MGKSSKKEWFVILNPHAGSGRGLKDRAEILKGLKKYDFRFKLATSDFPKHTILLTQEAIGFGFRKLIVAGGDGTLNEAVNGIFLQKFCPPEDITIGMIPVGTGNDWIKTFGIPNQYKPAIKILKKGETMRQDVGQINFAGNGAVVPWFFANMAGFGFDAMVAGKTNLLKEKGKKGMSLYLQALGTSFMKYKTAQTHIIIDEQEIDDLIFSASIGIGKFNGGGMMQAPDAIPDNGFFQVTLIRKIGIWGILRNLAGLYSGEFVKDRRVSTHHARHVSISADKNISGEADGETLGDNKFDIHLIPQKLNVIYNPEKYLKFK
jgi:YegS/Rv2252/BmrU family lipid kinase